MKDYSASTYFEEFKKNHYRKGFLVKWFNVKQIESQNIKPRPEERQLFLEIFDKNHGNNDDENSSDNEVPVSMGNLIQ